MSTLYNEPMIKKIDHINIVVSDLEASIQFFTTFLEFHLNREDTLEGPLN